MESILVQVNGIRLGVVCKGGDKVIQGRDKPGPYPATERLAKLCRVGAGLVPALDTTPTLVMLHGFTGSAAGWGRHLDMLAACGLRIIAFDLPGHGQSDAPADPHRYTMECCQQDILAALRELGVSQGQAV